MYIEKSDSMCFSSQLQAGSFLLRKKARKMCLISIKFNEAISEPQAILKLPSSINLNLQLVYLQWSEQVTFRPGISLYFLSICNLYIASASTLRDGKRSSLHTFLILNILKQPSIWLFSETLIPSSLATFLKFYSFHSFLYQRGSMALGESCLIQNGRRQFCHCMNLKKKKKKRKNYSRTFFFTAPYWKYSSPMHVVLQTEYYNESFLPHPCKSNPTSPSTGATLNPGVTLVLWNATVLLELKYSHFNQQNPSHSTYTTVFR